MGLNTLQSDLDEYYFPNKLDFEQVCDTYNLRGSEYYQLKLLILSFKHLALNRVFPK